MTTDLSIDLEALADSIDSQRRTKLYSCSTKVEEQPDFNGIFFSQLRRHLNIPLAIQDVNEICNSVKKAGPSDCLACKPCVISAKLLHVLSSEDNGFQNAMRYITTAVIQELFQVDLGVMIVQLQTELDSLVICHPGESFVGTFYRDVPGKFATLLLSVPIQGGYEGKVTINYDTEQTIYKFESAADEPNFVVTAMTGCNRANEKQEYIVETSSDKPVAVMVFNLIWTSFCDLSGFLESDDLACFISSISNVNQALAAWKPAFLSKNAEAPPASSVLAIEPPELTVSSLEFDHIEDDAVERSSVSEHSTSDQTEPDHGESQETEAPLNNPTRYGSDGVKAEPAQDDSLTKPDSNSSEKSNESLDEDMPPGRLVRSNHKLVCYTLTGSYTISKYSAANLKNDDLFAFQVFKSLSYIDVSLGVVVTNDHDDPDASCCCCYADEIASTKDTRYSSLLVWDAKCKSFSRLTYLDLDEQLVGELDGSIGCDLNARATMPPSFAGTHCNIHQLRHSVPCLNAEEDDCKTFNPVLVIQPKWIVYPQYPKLNFMPALNSLGSSWHEAYRDFLRGDSTRRDFVVSDIRRLIEFAFSPLAEMVPKDCVQVFNARELLERCLQFRAKHEGLAVLNCIADKRCPCGMHDFYAPLIGDSDLLLMITDFALQVAGWDVCSSAVLRLINNHKLNRFYLDVARRLVQRRCHTGAIQVVDKMLEKMNQMKKAKLDDYPVKFLAKVALFLDEIKKTIDLDLTKRLSITKCCMKRLAPARLLKELEEFFPHIEEPGALRKTFDDLAPLMANAKLRDICEQDFVKLLKACSQLENTCLLKKLWIKVRDEFKAPVNRSFDCKEESRLPMIHRIVMNVGSSAERIAVLESMSSLAVSHEILDGLISLCLKSFMASKLIKSYAPYYMFICLAENDDKLTKEGRIDAFCSNFKEWSVNKLCQLIVGLFDDDKRNLKKRKSSSEMYRRLIGELLERDTIKFILKSGKLFPRVVRCLLWFDDFGLVKKLVNRINEDREKSADVESLKALYENVPEIFNIPGVFGDLVNENYGKLDRNHAMSLIDTWLRAAMALAQMDREYIDNDKTFLSQTYNSYIKAEKYLPNDNDIGVHSLFMLFFSNLGFLPMARLIGSVCESEIEAEGISLKKFLTVFQNFKVLIYGLTYKPDFQNFVSAVTDTDVAKKLVKALFWVGDEAFLSKFWNTVSSYQLQDAKLAPFLRSVVECERIHQVVLKSADVGLKYFNMFVDRYVELINHNLRPIHTWSLYDVKCSCPVLRKFLQSHDESAIYIGNVNGAAVTPPDVFKYSRWSEKDGTAYTKVQKTRQDVIPPPDAKFWHGEMAKVAEIRKKLAAPQVSVMIKKESDSQDSADNVEVINPPANKRTRLDEPPVIIS